MTVLVKLVEWTAAFGLIAAGLFGERWWMHCHRPAAPATPVAPKPVSVQPPVQDVLDAAFHLATEQYYAGLETGQGGRMPTRAQVAADLASISGVHDEAPLSNEEALKFAALAAGFNRAFRPPITVEPADPDDAKYW